VAEEEKELLEKIESYLGYKPKVMEIMDDEYKEVSLFSADKKMELKDVLKEFVFLDKKKKKKKS
jgi:hypothetical protein